MADAALVIETENNNPRKIRMTGQNTLQLWLTYQRLQSKENSSPKSVYNMFDLAILEHPEYWLADVVASNTGNDKAIIKYDWSGDYFLYLTHVQAQAASILNGVRKGLEIPDYKASASATNGIQNPLLYRLVEYWEAGFYGKSMPYKKEDGSAPSDLADWFTEHSWHNTGTLGVNKVHFGKLAIQYWIAGAQYRNRHPKMPESLNGNNEKVRKRQILLKVCKFAIVFPFLYPLGMLQTVRFAFNIGVMAQRTISDKITKIISANILPPIFTEMEVEKKQDILQGELLDNDSEGHDTWIFDFFKYDWLDSSDIDATGVYSLITRDLMVPEDMLDLARNMWGASPTGFKDKDYFANLLVGSSPAGAGNANFRGGAEYQFGYDLVLALEYLRLYNEYLPSLFRDVQDYAHWTFSSAKDGTDVLSDFNCLTKYNFASNTKGICSASLYKPLRRMFSTTSYQTVAAGGKPIRVYPLDLCDAMSTNTYQYAALIVPHVLAWMLTWDRSFVDTDFMASKGVMTLEELKWDALLSLMYCIKDSDSDSDEKAIHYSMRFVEFIDPQNDKCSCLAFATYGEPRFENTFNVLGCAYSNVRDLYGIWIERDQHINNIIYSAARLPKEKIESYTTLRNLHLKQQVFAFIDTLFSQSAGAPKTDPKPAAKPESVKETAAAPSSTTQQA